jgi:glycosyltransferase involved in cell wall biosynthesis
MQVLDWPIGIDARMLHIGGTGVAAYSRSLEIAARQSSRDCYRIGASPVRMGRLGRWLAAAAQAKQTLKLGRVVDGMTELIAPDLFRRAHIHFGLRGELFELVPPVPYGIMHWAYPVPLVVAGWSNIYTVHDAIPLSHPQLTPISEKRHRKTLAAIRDRAARIVTVSEAAKREILDWTDMPEALVVNCGVAVNVEEEARLTEKDCVEESYFLYCGLIEHRKNLCRLLDAYQASGSNSPLHLVGPVGWRGSEILDRALQTPGVVYEPFLSRAELLSRMRGAKALLFPSLAEGFGLPIAEAMALATPVMTSLIDATAEVASDAALLVNPLDIIDMARAIRDLDQDAELRNALAQKGLRRAADFSMSAFVDRLNAVYSDAARRWAPPLAGAGSHNTDGVQ